MDDKVQEHEFTIRELKNLMGMMSNSVNTLTIDVKALSASVGKQEIILEKLANLKDEYKGSFDSIHGRIDKTEKENQALRDELQRVNETKAELVTKCKGLRDEVNDLKSDKKKLGWLILAPIVSAIMGIVLFK